MLKVVGYPVYNTLNPEIKADFLYCVNGEASGMREDPEDSDSELNQNFVFVEAGATKGQEGGPAILKDDDNK